MLATGPAPSWHPGGLADFDPHLYLRLLAERALLTADHDHGPWEANPVADAADALAAVGLMARPDADAVVSDFELASSLRTDPRRAAHRRRGHRSVKPVTPPSSPPRVVNCDWTAEVGGGTLHVKRVVFRTTSTRLDITWRPDPRGRRRSARSAPEPTLTDDQGRSEVASFSGGSDEHEWTGHLQTHQPMDAETTRLQIDTETLALGPDTPPAPVRIETLELDPNTAHRHLWLQVQAATSFMHGPRRQLEDAVSALVAAGALAADDPTIGETRAVLDQLRHGRSGGPSASTSIPEPWRSALSGGRRQGPEITIPVMAVTPLFDGMYVTVFGVDSDRDGWSMEAEWAGTATPSRWPDTSKPSVAWWGADDRGHRYLGHHGNWSSSDESGHGTIEFRSPLDGRAKKLYLLPTGPTQRAVIEVDLS